MRLSIEPQKRGDEEDMEKRVCHSEHSEESNCR